MFERQRRTIQQLASRAVSARRRPRHPAWWSALIVAMLGASLHAQSQAPYEQLQTLARQYPNLQPGQADHAALGHAIAGQFEEAVHRGNASMPNGDAAIARADELLKAADEKREKVQQLRDELERMTSGGQTLDSPWYVRYTLEEPLPLALLMAVLGGMMYAAWRSQKRGSLLAVAVLCAAAVVALPIAAMLVQTEAEDVTRKSAAEAAAAQTTAAKQAQIVQAQREALEADRQAAEALRGLWQHGQMTVPSAAFLPGAAVLAVEGGLTVYLEQLTPNLVEPANLPAEHAGETWQLFYVGRGSAQDMRQVGGALHARASAGGKSVAVMDFECGRGWLSAVQYGADAIIFLAPADDAGSPQGEAAQKFSESPLSIPRFYAERAAIDAALGDGWQGRNDGIAVTLAQPQAGRWISKPAVIDWLFIPGSAPADSDLAGQLVHIQTYRDTASVTPGRSPSAHTLGNLVLMQRLLEQMSAPGGRPRRPVLLSVVDQHANAMQGEQAFAYFAFVEPRVLKREMEWLDERLAYETFVHRTYSQPLSAEFLEGLRHEQTTVGGKRLKSKEPILSRLTELRSVWRDRRAELQRQRVAPAEGQTTPAEAQHEQLTARIDAEVAQIENRMRGVVRLMMLFNQIGDKVSYSELDAAERTMLQEVFDEVAGTAAIGVAQMQEALDQVLGNLTVRRKLRYLTDRGEAIPAGADYDRLFAMQYQAVPHTIVFCLDVGFATDRLGFFHFDDMTAGTFAEASVVYNDANNAVEVLAGHAVELAQKQQPNLLVDTLRKTGSISWQQHMGGKVALGSSVMAPLTVPALTLASVQDQRGYAFTPLDTVDRVDPAVFDRVARFVDRFLPALVSSPDLARTISPRGTPTPIVATVSARLQEQFSTTEPKKPASNAVIVVAATPGSAASPAVPANHCMFAQVRPHLVLMANQIGTATVRGGWHNGQAVHAFIYDDQYQHVRAAADAGLGMRQFPGTLTVPTLDYFAETILPLSELQKVDLVGLTSPLTLSPLPGLRVLDAEEDNPPRHWGIMGLGVETEGAVAGKAPFARDGTASVFIEPGSRFKLRLGESVALNVTEERLKGIGFPADQRLIRDLAQVSYRDMHMLTNLRLRLLADKGVTEQMARQFVETGENLVERGVDPQGHAVELDQLSLVSQARGLMYRAYVRAKSIINDLTTAVIVFMALIIPFCFFVMKLVTPYTDIGRQLLMFGIIFALMVAVLYFVHPAFSISDAPIVVVLAFIILGLAGFVSFILIGRFNASMTQLVEQVLQSESADASQSRLFEAAFLVGVNNMKRRRIRTTLTTATIILVTFTMLSVISVGQEVDPAMVRQGDTAEYNGFVFRRPGNDGIHPLQMSNLRRRYGAGAVTVARAWGQREVPSSGAYLGFTIQPVSARLRPLVFNVLLGLERQEDGFIAPLPLTAGKWFSGNDAAEIVLSVDAARKLGYNVDPATFQPQPLELLGMKLTLVGVLDDAKMLEFKDLAGVPVLPLATELKLAQPVSPEQLAKDEAAGTKALDAGGGDTSRQPVAPNNVAFMPIDLVQSLGIAGYRSLSIKYVPVEGAVASPAQRAWIEANQMIRFQHQLLQVGLTEPVEREGSTRLRPGQYTLMSSTSTQVGGVLKAAIPIILAATIILNTMLGSVLERKREVSIYNAIGLNPGHVMIFFLAESLVFGVVGAVAGYLIGQALSILITQFQIVDLNLNYSSLSVIMVIVLTIATVLLSTVYPAMMAARAAVPSGQRRWSLPRPDGDQIHVNFPFSYDARRVLGVCSYLYEYMEQNSEASTGKFLARPGPVGLVPALAPQSTGGGTSSPTVSEAHAFAMIFDIAPSPFDLGVNQKMEVYACYNPRVRAHMLSVHLTRTSGERNNWVTVNQPFLESLRKRLLAWRSQSAEIQSNYYEKGERLFADASMLPTKRS